MSMDLSTSPAVYEEILASHRAMVRELDVLLNGEAGAAKQARLADLIAQVRRDGLIVSTPTVKRDMALGAALERAAGELPEGWELRVEVERGCGDVALYDEDGTRHDEFSGDTMGGKVESAIGFACERAGDAGEPD